MFPVKLCSHLELSLASQRSGHAKLENRRRLNDKVGRADLVPDGMLAKARVRPDAFEGAGRIGCQGSQAIQKNGVGSTLRGRCLPRGESMHLPREIRLLIGIPGCAPERQYRMLGYLI